MVNPQIVDYIRTQLRQGATKASIMTSMTAGGWNQADVEGAFNEATQGFEPIKSSDSFAPVVQAERGHPILKTIGVIILIVIIILCILFFIGSAEAPAL
jgi:hypothetical protein